MIMERRKLIEQKQKNEAVGNKPTVEKEEELPRIITSTTYERQQKRQAKQMMSFCGGKS